MVLSHDLVFGELQQIDGGCRARVVRGGRNVEIMIETDDPTVDLEVVVGRARHLYERLDSATELDLRGRAATELQKAAYSQCEDKPSASELRDAVQSMVLVFVSFDEDGALLGWSVGDFLAQNEVLTAQIDLCLQIDPETIEVQES